MGWLTDLDNKRSLKKLQKIADKIDFLEDKYLPMTVGLVLVAKPKNIIHVPALVHDTDPAQ